MGIPVYRPKDSTFDLRPPQDPSVFDSYYTRAMRLLTELMGGYDPAGSMMGVAGPLTVAGRGAKAAGKLIPMLDRAAETARHLEVAPVERINNRLLISTRVPGGVRPPVATGGPLTAGVSDIAQDPALLKKVADEVRTYPMLRPREARMNDQGVIDAFVDRSAENLDALIAMQPKEHVQRAAGWYQGGHRLANELAAEIGVTGDQAAGVLASQSPSKEWPQNVELARRIGRAWRQNTQTDPPFTREQAEHAVRSTIDSAEEWIRTNKLSPQQAAQHRARTQRKVADIQQQIGRRWSELPLRQQSQMVRATSELHEPATFPIWSPEGEIVTPIALSEKTGDPRRLTWQSYANIDNALSMLHSGSDESISRGVGEGQKVRSFFNNLNVPTDPRSVTVDTHNIGGAHLRPMGGKAPEVRYVMAGPGSAKTGLSGAHGLYRDAVIRAAQPHNLRPNQAQSVTWESIKGLFSPAQRRDPAFTDQARRLWEEYAKGRIKSLEELHSRIYDLAGGLTPPEWAR